MKLSILKNKILWGDWSFLGVVLFFIIHGYCSNIEMIPLKPLALLLIGLLIAAYFIFFISKKVLASDRKANIFTSLVGIAVLFFGVFQNLIAQFRFLSEYSRLRFFLPFILLMLAWLFIWLKNTKASLQKAILFMNVLLIIYIGLDTGMILQSRLFPSERDNWDLAKQRLSTCDSCDKPSVYLVLLDSYFGSKGLKEYFNYDNSGFENFLKSNGFHVVQASHSNYIYTIYSMASSLNMQYLGNVGQLDMSNHNGFITATTAIKENIVCKFFARQGYQINNFSIFDLPFTPSNCTLPLLTGRMQLINSQTMYYKVVYAVPFILEHVGMMKKSRVEFCNTVFNNNEDAMKQTLAASNNSNYSPQFTYLHLLMPHEPLLLDSNGNKTKEADGNWSLPKDSVDNMFLQYEVYVNKRIASFITQLKKLTADKAVIIVMSDHGYRGVKQGSDRILPFYNLNAIYLPKKNYEGWYNGISNVNQFKVLLNTLFHQQMTLLPDSIVTR